MKYCSRCGRRLIRKIVNASNFIKSFPNKTYDAFNGETGKENLMIGYKCPKYNSFFGMYHDYFGKEIKEDK
jgi:hypothetical protein